MASLESAAAASPDAPRLERLDEGLFTATAPFSTGGLQIGMRMNAVVLPSGGVVLHSPIRFDPALHRAVTELGPVRALVAPNLLHHLFLGDWAEACPEARLHGPVGLPDKRKDLRFERVLLDGAPDPDWDGVLEVIQFYGVPRANEVVFRHVPTRTLLLTDLAFHICGDVGWLTRLYLRLGNCHGRLTSTALLRLLVRDRARARESVERLAGLDFERIVVAHGEVLEHGGPAALREAFAWL